MEIIPITKHQSCFLLPDAPCSSIAHKHTLRDFGSFLKERFSTISDALGHFCEEEEARSKRLFFFRRRLKRTAPLAFVMCRQRADVIDPGPSEFIRRSSPTVPHLYLCCCPLPGLPLSLFLSPPHSLSAFLFHPPCIILLLFFYSCLIAHILVRIRPVIFGSCLGRWWETSRGRRRWTGGRRRRRRVGVKNALCPLFSSSDVDLSLSLFLFLLSLSLSLSLTFAVSLCNENLSLIEVAAASWPRVRLWYWLRDRYADRGGRSII